MALNVPPFPYYYFESGVGSLFHLQLVEGLVLGSLGSNGFSRPAEAVVAMTIRIHFLDFLPFIINNAILICLSRQILSSARRHPQF